MERVTCSRCGATEDLHVIVLDTRRGNRRKLLQFDASAIQAMAWGEGEDWVLVLTADVRIVTSFARKLG